VERANRAVFLVVSKTLFNLRKGKWVEELLKVVWSHNTTTFRTIGFTPFKLLYGEEAMLPEEIKHESLHTMQQTMAEDEEYSKETIEGIKLEVVNNILKYQAQTKKWKDKSIVRKDIQERDLVLRRKANAATTGKLQPKWQGPYTAIAVGRLGSFFLVDGEGKTTTHAWNISNLRKFYI
jgi:hypothetical protein